MEEQDTDLSFFSCDSEERSVKQGDVISKKMASMCMSLCKHSAGEDLRQSSRIHYAAFLVWIRVIVCLMLKARLWNRGPSAPGVRTQVP